jgi:hypothetical protein
MLSTSATALTGFLCLALTAAAATAQTGFERYQAAAKAFDEIKASAATKGEMPRITDTRTAELLAILSDTADAYGSAGFPSGMDAMTKDTCSIPNKIASGYALHGLDVLFREQKVDNNTDPKEISAKVAVLYTANVSKYQAEVVPVINFARRCLVGTLPALAEFIKGLPPQQMTDVRREGLRKMRQGLQQMIIGAVTVLTDTGLRDDLRNLMFIGLQRDLPSMVAALTLAERAQARAAIEGLRPSMPVARHPDILNMVKVLSNTTCDGLCGV